MKKQQKSFETKTPIATDMFIPNLSGDHSKGRVNTTPTTDFEIANKKYVDDSSTSPGGSDTQVQFNDGGSAFGGDAGLTYNKTTDSLTILGNLTVGTENGEQILFVKGSKETPNLTLASNPNMGFYFSDAANMIFVVNGTNVMGIDTNGIELHRFGTAAIPTVSHDGDGNTGMYWLGSDRLGLSAGGVEMIRLHETTQDVLIFNEDGLDIDFRVESDGDTHAFFLQGSDGFIGIGTSSPICELDVDGGFAANLVSKTANYTATSSDHTILCGSGNETFTVTLPAASGVSGIIYNIKNIGTGTITVDGNASETIDGGVTATLSNQFECITIQCDGSNWHII